MNEQIVISVFTVLIDIALIFYIVKNRKRKILILNPLLWIIFSWQICITLYCFAGIDYANKLSISSYFYLIFCFFMVIAGWKIGAKFTTSRKKKISEKENKKNIVSTPTKTSKFFLRPTDNVLNILFYASLVSLIIMSIKIILDNPDAVLGQTTYGNMNIDYVDTILLFVTNSSLIIWLYGLISSIKENKKIGLRTIISAIIFLIPGVLTSGRDSLIIFIVSSLIIIIYLAKTYPTKHNKAFRDLFIILAIGSLAILIYLILLSSNRYGKSESIIELFSRRANCSFSEPLTWIVNSLGGFGKLIVNTIYYYSSQISKLAIIIENYDGPFLFGMYNFHYIARRINIDTNTVKTAMQQLLYTKSSGGLISFWSTFVGWLIYDFSIYGTPIILSLLGTVINRIKTFFNQNKNAVSLILQAIICTGCFISVETSPFSDYGWIFPLVWIVLIIFYDKKATPNISKKAAIK